MGLWDRIKNFFKRTFSGGSSGGGGSDSYKSASRVSNYGGGGGRSYSNYSSGGYEHEYQSYQRRRELERQERKKKQQATTDALASISKRTDALSSGRSPSVANNGTTRVLAKIGQKATPPDPKEKARQSSQQRATAQLKKISDNRKSYNKATKDRYNVDKNGTKARIAQKSQAYDVDAEKWETKHHPVATSFARGAASGVTFGGSELLAQRSKNRQRSGAEQFYQQNKSRGAEVAGEVAGSLVGFGLTGGASAKAVGKVAPKAVSRLSARGTEKLASSAAIRRAAEKEAIKRFGAEGATKEVINQIARRRASAAMAELGKDAAINVTTGLASDLSHSYLDASKDGAFDRGEFARSMGTNAALNTVLGGATSLVPAFRVGRNFDDAIEGAVRNVAEEQADDAVKVSLNRRRRTDVRMPEVRPQIAEAPVQTPRRGYHAGDLGKAEWYGNQAGSNRGTGHFGTGTYFAGSEDILRGGGYGDRPLWEINYDNYNLYRPSDRDQGMRVHQNLKKLNVASKNMDSLTKRAKVKSEDVPNLVRQYDEAATTEDLENIAERLFSKRDREAITEAAEERLALWREQGVNPDYDFDIDDEISSMISDADLADLNFNDIDSVLDVAAERSAARRANAPVPPQATFEQAYKTELSDTIGKYLNDLNENGNEIRKALQELGEDLGATPEQIDNALAKTQELIDAYAEHSVFLKEDSASTIFMKELGYEGVDVSHIEGLDNTEFGSVIYDLHPEDAKKVREGRLRRADESVKTGEPPQNIPAEPQRPRTPTEVMTGYKSNGYRKRVADAKKRIKTLLDNGDTRGAREEIDRAVDDIVRNTRIEEPLEDNIAEIKEVLRNTPISTSTKYKTDAGYKSGGFNEFRKGNFGSLKLTNDGTPIDELWIALQERFGRSLFPDEIDIPSEQLQYLSDLAKTKGRELELPDDEIAHLREQLSESLWESANKGRDHAPFNVNEEDWLTEQAASRAVSDEELAALEQRAIEDGLIDERVPATEPRPTEPSQFAQIDEGMEGIDAEAERQAQRTLSQTQEEGLATKIEEDATGRPMTDEEIKARRENTAKAKKAETKINPRRMPKGERLTERVTKDIEGADFESATKPASAKEIVEAEKKYVRGQASNYENVVSRGGTSLASATGNEAELNVIKSKIDDGSLNYARVKNKEKYEWAVKDFVDNKETVSKKMLQYADDIDSIPASQLVDTHYQAHAVMKMMRSQLDNPELTQAERDAAREIYGAAASLTQQLSSLSGQINQFQGVMVHCDGKTRMRNAVDNIANMLDASRGFRTSKTGKGLSGNAFQRKNQIRDIIYSDPDASKALEKIIDAATEEEYGNAMQELLYATSKMNRKSALDYVQTWRYLSMLGNPKTHVRNILGNVTFGGIRNLSNTNRSFIEKALEGYAHNHGLVIDRHGKISPKAILEANTDKPTSDAGKAAKEWFEKNQDKILGGEGKYAENATKASSPAYLKWLDGLSNANSKALQAEDNFFRKRAYKQSFIKSYDQYVKDGKEITPELLEKIHNSSMLESQVATFNEFNELAQALSKCSHPDYNASAGKKLAGWAVNAVMPFTKVPANIGKQAVNYSPIGVARGITNISNAAKTGDSKVFNRALDELSSGLTGTGIAALGFFLGKDTDMFTTNAGTDDYAAKFKKQQGVQNYSMMFKDPSSGETYSLTLDWLVPASATFFAGVEMANQMKRGYGDLFEFIGDMSQVTSRVIEPVLETSMLSGLYNIVEGARSSTGEDDKQNFLSLTLRELTQSYANSLVPTFQGQLARTAYDSDLQLTGETDWEYWMNSMKSKMGLATTDAFGTQALGADTTAYGDVKGEKKTGEDRLKSLLKNTLSPANIQKVDLDEMDQAKIKQYEDAVKNGADPQEMSYLFPKKQYKKQFTTGNLDVKMSNRDLSTYNQAKTTGGAEGARYALESIMFNRYTKDENGNKQSTADAYTPEQKAAIIQQFDGKSIRDVEKWVREQPQFKNSTEAEQKKVIDGLWSYSKQGKAQSAKRVGEQAVIKAQGKDVNEYNFNNEITEKKRETLQPLVDSGIVTYEQAVDFARYAGKTYYYEDDEGGHSQTYYNKGVMYDYLDKMGYDDETKAALFNAFKAWNAKEYGASSGKRGGRRGYRRRGYRSYGGSTAKATVPKPKTIKASDLKQGESLAGKSKSSSTAKVTPPKLKRVQAKIDLPTVR